MPQYRDRPIPVMRKIIVGYPDYGIKTRDYFSFMKKDRIFYLLNDIFRRSFSYFPAEMPYDRTVVAIMRTASGSVNLRP
jgi:hypothetical protein